MSAEKWIVNNKTSLDYYIKQVRTWFEEEKYVTFSKPRFGIYRSLDQNALFHVWLSEMAAFYANIHIKNVPRELVEGMKRTVKQRFLIDNPAQKHWMICEIVCPLTGNRKKDYASSSKYKTGEMFMMLNWLQDFAAKDGLILESKGQFLQLQEKQNA